MGRPTPYYLLDVKIRPTERQLEVSSTPDSPSGFDKIAHQPTTVPSGPPCRPRQPSSEGPSSSEAAPRRASERREGRKHPDRRRASCLAFLPWRRPSPSHRRRPYYLRPRPRPAPSAAAMHLLLLSPSKRGDARPR
jgi:hypothetical protein